MEFEQARGAIERADSVDKLSAVLVDLRNESGLAHLVYHAAHVPAFNKSNPLLLLTYDDAWVKRYVERDYFSIDPVVLAGRKLDEHPDAVRGDDLEGREAAIGGGGLYRHAGGSHRLRPDPEPA
jgi:Autoinducer binding domain